MGNGEWGTSGHRFFQISSPNFNCNSNPNLGINPTPRLFGIYMENNADHFFPVPRSPLSLPFPFLFPARF